MKKSDEQLFKQGGWEVECESPLEIRHEDGSFATQNAAIIVLSHLRVEKFIAMFEKPLSLR